MNIFFFEIRLLNGFMLCSVEHHEPPSLRRRSCVIYIISGTEMKAFFTFVKPIGIGHLGALLANSYD